MSLRSSFIVSSVIQSKLIYIYEFLTEMKDLKIKLYLILNIVQMVVSNASIYLDYFQYFLKYNIKLEFLIDYES